MGLIIKKRYKNWVTIKDNSSIDYDLPYYVAFAQFSNFNNNYLFILSHTLSNLQIYLFDLVIIRCQNDN